MNWQQLIASLVGSLAWPVTVFASVLLLRIPITKLLLSIKRIKYKDGEVEFGRELKQAQEEAGAIKVTSQNRKTLLSTNLESARLLSEAERLAQDFPEPAVTVGWRAVELELELAVARSVNSPDYSLRNSILKNGKLLQDRELIDAVTFLLLMRLFKLRNIALHGRDNTGNITTDQALEFIDLARGLVEKLGSLLPEG